MDNMWSYLKTHGDDRWKDYPSYYSTVVPILINLFNEFDLKLTFFIVGQDAALEKNKPWLKTIVAAGHEIGNHSFNHEPWMHTYSDEQITEEITSAHHAIKEATNADIVGFRSPGFCYSKHIFETVSQLGYQFDASIFPSIIGPLARLYYLFGAKNMTQEQRETRQTLFGRFSDGFHSLKPFTWDTNKITLLEIPVTTMPIFRLPFHMSYIIWLSRYSKSLALFYFNTAVRLCRLFGIEPSLILHPTDLLGKEDAPEMSFFPGMDLERKHKISIIKSAITSLQKSYDLVKMSEHAKRIKSVHSLKTMVPKTT